MRKVLGAFLVALMLLPAVAYATHDTQAHWTDWPVTIDRIDGHDIDGAAEWWNRLAGHDVFQPVDEGGQIRTVKFDQTYVRHDDGFCEVYLAPIPHITLIHELGHCLGFEDHTPDGTDLRTGRDGLGTCDTYEGIMSYCPWPPVARDDDIKATRELTGGPDYSRTVAIVNADRWPDAVAATALDADVLYVTDSAVPDATWNMLHLYDRAIVVGGEDSVSDFVYREINSQLPTVRVAGVDRVSTAAELARINELASLGL